MILIIKMVRGLFKNFRKFIGSYVEKVIVYKDHVEVVFFFSCGGIEIEDAYRFKKEARRTKLKSWLSELLTMQAE